MLDQLRIHCPSCSIILDVGNSKHEAVKQIVCPNCKKRLAVNFGEELGPTAPPQPIEPLYYGEMRIDLKEGINEISLPNCDKAEIKVVRLRDGNSKTLVRPLTDDILVKVDRVALKPEEQVALSAGNCLEIGTTMLRVAEPGSMTLSPEEPSAGDTPNPVKPEPSRNFIWLYAAIAFAVLMVITICLWPSESAEKQVADTPLLAQRKDTVIERNIADETKDAGQARAKDSSKGHSKTKGAVVEPVSPSGGLSKMSDFDLEKKALGGSIDAQYEFGARLIKRGGVNNHVRGIKYLKLAANNGSSRARSALSRIIASLQERANDGDSISYYILKSI